MTNNDLETEKREVKWVTVVQLAQVLSKNEETIRRWQREGRITANKKLRPYMYDLDLVMKQLGLYF